MYARSTCITKLPYRPFAAPQAGAKKAGGFSDHNARWLKPAAQKRREEPSSEEEEGSEEEVEAGSPEGLGSDEEAVAADGSSGGEEDMEELSGEEFSDLDEGAPACRLARACLP